MSRNDESLNYYKLIQEQDEIFERIEPYIYLDGIISQVKDDAPEEVKADFQRMIELTPKIQMAKLYV